MLKSSLSALGKIAGALLVMASSMSSAVAQYVSPYTSPWHLGPQRYETPVGIQYFGHLMSGYSGKVGAENVREVEGHSNLVALVHSTQDPTKNAGALSAIGGGKVYAMLFVDSVFQAADGSELPVSTINANIVALRSAVGSKLADVKFMAFDETMWRRQMGYCGSNTTCLNNGPVAAVVSQMVPKMEAWTQRLRTEFPGIGVAYIEAHTMVRPTAAMQLPVNVDIYGFDCYGPAHACSKDESTGTSYSIQDLMTTLKGKVVALNNSLGGFRRLAFVPPAFMAFDRSMPRNDSDMTGNAQLTVDRRLIAPSETPDTAALHLLQAHMAQASDPMVAMVGGFMWSTLEEGNVTIYGARGLPQVRAYLEQYGRDKLHRGVSVNTYPPVIEFTASSGVQSNTTGAIWTWATTNATSCRSVTESAYRNLPPNGVLYVPPQPATSYDYTIECTGPYGSTQKTLHFTVSDRRGIGDPRCATTPGVCR